MAAAGPRIGLDLRQVPKLGGGVRVLTHFDAPTARTYAEIVASVAPWILSMGARGSFGMTTPPIDLAAERARWRMAVAAATHGRPAIASDVRACYPSITPDAVGAGLAAAGAHPHDAERLQRCLMLIERAGVPGLPIGPSPSAIVAEAVLRLGDRAVADVGATVVRWVDDVVISAPDRATTMRAFDAWRTRLRALGLVPHEGKTSLLETGCDTWEPSGSWARARGMMRAP